MNLEDLGAPFPAEDVEFRVQSSGTKKDGVWARVLAYITARAIMTRLDQVCGVTGWKVSYQFPREKGVICTLSIWDPEKGEWVPKEDGAEETEIEGWKGGISSALKRAGACYGIGRYLYNLDAMFAECSKDPKKFPHYAKLKDGTPFSWAPPALPAWALPAGDATRKVASRAPEPAPPALPAEALPAGDATRKVASRAPEPAPAKERDRPLITDGQLRHIKALQRELEIPDKAYRAGLKKYYGVTTAKDLFGEQAEELIGRLEAKRRADVDDDAAAAFGDGRIGKLRQTALGFLARVEKIAGPIDLMRAGLICADTSELREVVEAMGEEKELEDVAMKLERLIEGGE